MNILKNNEFSKEIEIVLLCSGTGIERQDLERIKSLCTQNIDWDFFKRLVIRNRVYVIVYHNLKLIKESLSENFLSELKALTLSTGSKNFRFTMFLQKLMADLNQAGIFVLPFKGPALAEHVYKDIIFRPFSDLDILVGKSDAVQASNILKQRGLVPQLELNDSQFKKYMDDEDHFSFYDPKQKITIELHWDMSGLYLLKQITVSDLKDHITTGTLNKKGIPCLLPEMLLIYLCIHASKHGWEYLELICCIAALIKQNPRLNWEKIIKLSSDWQCKKMLFLGLYLAARLFKSFLPDTVRIKMNDDKTIFDLSDKIIDNLFSPIPDQKNKQTFSDRFSAFHIKIRDSYIDKIRYLLRLMFRPTDKEWLYFPVPAYLSFVHYFLRPCRLIFCKLKGEHA